MADPLNVQRRERTNTNPANSTVEEDHTYLLNDVVDCMRQAGSPIPEGSVVGVKTDAPNLVLTFLNPTYPQEPPLE